MARRWSFAFSALGAVGFVGLWSGAAAFVKPVFLPSPVATVRAAAELAASGFLLDSVLASLGRIGAGWTLGGVLGIPAGLLMGRLPRIRVFLTPFIQGLRYIPPIAFVSLFLVWFGAGEASKVMLVLYTTLFVVVINTMAGAMGVREGVVRAAQSLGATEAQVLFRVVIPETVPHIITGLRIAMGNAFVVIAAAEMIAARSGMGQLIWSARNLMLTDQVFVGFLVLGALGLTADRSFRLVTGRFLAHFRVV